MLGCACPCRGAVSAPAPSSLLATHHRSLIRPTPPFRCPPSAPPPVRCLHTASPPPSSPFRVSSGIAASTTSLLSPASVSIPVGDRQIIVETGLIGRQANGAVTVSDGETVLYTTVCAAVDPSDVSDFAPLTVQYQERLSAAGRTSGGFIKREGRARENEILVCRLIDRPIRPLVMKGFNYETQVLVWVLSYDGVHAPEPLAITAAGAALALSDIPFERPVAGVRVGFINGVYVVNPTVQELALSKLDMVIAGTSEAVLMIEGYCDFLSEEELLKAVQVGQQSISVICKELEKFARKLGKPKNLEALKLPPLEIEGYIQDLFGDELATALQLKSKRARGAAISALEDKILTTLTEEGVGLEQVAAKDEERDEVWDEEEEEELVVEDGEVDEGDVHVKPVLRKPITELFDPSDVKRVLKDVSSKVMRELVVKRGLRSDGRGVMDVRPIQSLCGLLPRAHGSALFTRGETQALAVVTLGGNDMAQRLDNLNNIEDIKRFYLQYSFPPSCVGETGRIGVPSRREIGHGTLAERALEPVLPPEADFPYTIRVESTITESNGSSSMASVCGGCLAMLDAGIPLKGSIAGVAMGLILNTKECGGDGEPVILTDILGSEDALGDMDFKVAGNENGITAFQMDIKVEGITVSVLQKALSQAKIGRCRILAEMTKSSPPPAMSLSKYAPLIAMMKVDSDKLNIVIGPGGKMVKSIIEETGVDTIDIEDDGSIVICGKTNESLELAKSRISGLTMVPVVGQIYRNCRVKSVVTFGCFVEIAPAREALLHISELSTKRIARVEDVVNVDDVVDVKLIEINARGQLRVSIRALLTVTEERTSRAVGEVMAGAPDCVDEVQGRKASGVGWRPDVGQVQDIGWFRVSEAAEAEEQREVVASQSDVEDDSGAVESEDSEMQCEEKDVGAGGRKTDSGLVDSFAELQVEKKSKAGGGGGGNRKVAEGDVPDRKSGAGEGEKKRKAGGVRKSGGSLSEAGGGEADKRMKSGGRKPVQQLGVEGEKKRKSGARKSVTPESDVVEVHPGLDKKELVSLSQDS